jgi:ParB family chromosome partitioning protein
LRSDTDIEALERHLGDVLGLNVRIGHGEKGGTLTLSYATLDQLDMLCQRLSGELI